jgi:hypothetical protein
MIAWKYLEGKYENALPVLIIAIPLFFEVTILGPYLVKFMSMAHYALYYSFIE